MLSYKSNATTLLLLCLVAVTVSLIESTCPTSNDKPPMTNDSDNNGDFCPPWMSLSSGSCKCEEVKHKNSVLKCCEKDRSLTVLACYCVSYYSELNKTLVGNCLYSCSLAYYHTIQPLQLNKTCEKYNRCGELCGKCHEGLGYPVYSYSSKCTNCTAILPGVFKYLVMAFIPLTVFYLIVIIFRISVTSEKMVGYVMVSQILTMPAQVRYISTLHTNHAGMQAIKIALSMHGIWNLDFFKSLYGPFCFNYKMSSLAVVSLDYLVALYPLCLIILTYIIVRIHDKSSAMTRAWKPVQKMMSHLRHRWNIRKSLVDAFATFLLLSYMKILNASFDILIPTVLHDMQGRAISTSYLYYDGSQRLFHGHHSGYTFLAIFTLVLFNATPVLLLLLYPCRCFQSLLNQCGRSRFQLMHTFMDSFQGCYKLSPIDCRYFAAINLLVRVLNLVTFSVTLTRFYFLFACTIFLSLAMLVVILKPYRVSKQNTLDATLYLVLAFGYLSAAGYAVSPEQFYRLALTTFIVISILMIFMYFLFMAFYDSTLIPLYAKLKAIIGQRSQRLQEIDEALFLSMTEGNETTPLLKTGSLTEAKEKQRYSYQEY